MQEDIKGSNFSMQLTPLFSAQINDQLRVNDGDEDDNDAVDMA